jgi:predicted PurR-regulated permease PerM
MGEANRGSHTVVTLAAVVIVIAGAKVAAPLLVPLVLSLFLALLLSPLLAWLLRKGVPRPLAFALVITAVFSIFVALTGLVSTHVADLFAHADDWQAAMMENLRHWIKQLESRGIPVNQELFFSIFQPQKLFGFTLSIVKNTSLLLSNSLLIFFTIVFMLIESQHIKEKIRYIERHRDMRGFAERLDRFTDRIHHYFTLKALTSAMTGLWIVAVLYAFDVPYPLLWGLGGFMLNFVPVIGSIIAAIPPVLLTLATHGFEEAMWVGGWFLVINVTIGNVLEPKIMGKGLGLSELVVFVSLVFWGWIFGKVGMLLAVPLTMVVKFALEVSPSTQWLAVLLSKRVPGDGSSR